MVEQAKKDHDVQEIGVTTFDVVKENLDGQPMLIEASAGTGKTYSLERLVARLIVEKAVPIQSLLIMTFTRAATAELSVRIRKILMKYRDALRTVSREDADRHLSEKEGFDDVDRELLEKWLRAENLKLQDCTDRLSDALNRFDDAAVFTIHSFCQKMLADYVFTRGGSFEMTIGNDDAQVSQALDEVLRKTYAERKKDENFVGELQQWQNWEEKLGVLKSQPSDIDLDVWSAQDEGIIPEDPVVRKQKTGVSDEMVAWIKGPFKNLPTRIRELKQFSRTLTFDDLLLELSEALKRNAVLADSISQRFKAVLVDEFQDTDPIQFNILKRLFLDAPQSDERYVFFVGDPKQAIYGFRSAELETYHEARQQIKDKGYIRRLETNFRSTPALVHAVNTFFAQAGSQSRFLNEKIQYVPVKSNPRKLPLMRKTASGEVPVPAFELWTNALEDTRFTEKEINQWQAKAIATDIVSLLDGKVYYGEKTLAAKDIAILVKKRTGADAVIKELAERGIRTRLNSNESVFQSTEAIEILTVLDAMIAPDRLDAVIAARATRLVGHSLKAIQEDESGAQSFRDFIKSAASRVLQEGVYPVFTELMRQYKTVERLLPLLKGARYLANYRHVLELMQLAQQDHGDMMGIAHWLRKAITGDESVSDEDVSKLRIESDDNLVNIVTIHASKGLEYPVVYLCDAVGTRVNTRQRRSIFREDRNGRRGYVLTDEPIPVNRHPATYQREEAELVRLAYVGMTRASARMVLPLVLGTPPTATKNFSKFLSDSVASAYVRALYAKPVVYDENGKRMLADEERIRKKLSEAVTAWKHRVEEAETPFTHLFKWRYISGQNDKSIPVNEKPLKKTGSHYKADAPNALPKTWGRTSFSGINRKLAIEKTISGASNHYAAFPKGTVPGDFLHNLIEKAVNQHIDLSEPSENVLLRFIQHQMAGKSFFATENKTAYQDACLHRLGYQDGEMPASFAEYCEKWITHCLYLLLTEPIIDAETGTAINIGALVRNRQVVPEIDFMLTAPGRKGPSWHVSDLVKGLKELSLKADLSTVEASLNGYLTGQIDLLLKNTDGKYWVIDWKSNAIDTEDSCDNPENYTKDMMKAVMDEHHYHLQALCYTVALFRYLQQRYPEKNPEAVFEMLGGAAYVFLRGVEQSEGHGIYSGIYWMPIETIKKQVKALNSILLGQKTVSEGADDGSR